MLRTLSFLFLFSLIFSFGYTHRDARAQIGVWFFDTIINPDATLLEASGGSVFPDIDTFITLIDEDRGNLQVYNINRNTRTIVSTSTIPVTIPTFGLGHRIRGLNGTAHSCFTEDGDLVAINSQNGVDWEKVLISDQDTFVSCETAIEDNSVFVGVCNRSESTHNVFESDDNGQTWNLIETIDNVLCPIEGTRPTFNRIDGESVVFYMTGANVGVASASNNPSNTTRLEAPGELVKSVGNEMTVVDTDVVDSRLAESFPPKKLATLLVTVTAYYHRESNTIRLLVDRAFNEPEVVVLGTAPLIFDFIGVACVEGPDGIVNVLSPGRHFQYNVLTGGIEQIPVFPFQNQTDGAMAVSGSNFFVGPDGTTMFFPAIYPGSIDYGQFGLVQRNVPTLSEWGLIATAGILGLIGFIAIRRRKVSA